MTDDELKALVASNAQAIIALIDRQRESDERLNRIEKICESNAKAVTAWGNRTEEIAIEIEESTTASRANLNRKIDTVAMGLQGLIRARRDDRAQFREQQAQQREAFDQRFTVLIEDARADRKTATQHHTEAIQRIDEALARGDRDRAKSVYQGMTPLTPDDIADAILFAVTRPAHVNVSEIFLMPTDQSSVSLVHRRPT